MARHNRPIPDNQAGFGFIELLVALAILGLLAALAIPTFRKLQAKAHHAETKSNLSRVFMAEAAYFAEAERYGSFSEIGFALQGASNRYSYRSPAAGGGAGSTATPNVDLINAKAGATWPENTFAPSGATLYVPGTPASFTATATGNIDSDATIDQWHINQLKQGLQTADSDDSAN